MPASAVHDDQGVGAWDDGPTQLVEHQLHGRGRDVGENQRNTGVALGADGTEQIGRLVAEVTPATGPMALLEPATTGPAGLANALEGMSRDGAAKQAGMDRQTLRDWVLRFNQAGVEGLHDRPRRGRPSFLTEGQLATFKAWVLRGPDPERDGRSSWTAKDLCRLVEDRFAVSYSENGMLRLLHELGLSWQKTRPVHPQADLKMQQAFKKSSRR
jgi:transposase